MKSGFLLFFAIVLSLQAELHAGSNSDIISVNFGRPLLSNRLRVLGSTQWSWNNLDQIPGQISNLKNQWTDPTSANLTYYEYGSGRYIEPNTHPRQTAPLENMLLSARVTGGLGVVQRIEMTDLPVSLSEERTGSQNELEILVYVTSESGQIASVVVGNGLSSQSVTVPTFVSLTQPVTDSFALTVEPLDPSVRVGISGLQVKRKRAVPEPNCLILIALGCGVASWRRPSRPASIDAHN